MLIKDLKPYIKDEYKAFEEKINNTELSKNGLKEFHKRTNKYLIVSLMDKDSVTCFDTSGTYPAEDSGEYVSYDGTGAYVNVKERRVGYENAIQIIADVPNVFDCINFFENGLDLKNTMDWGENE